MCKSDDSFLIYNIEVLLEWVFVTLQIQIKYV